MVAESSRSSRADDHLSGAGLYLLLGLSSGAKHGHALMKDIERFAGVHLGPGTLYKALGRLEEDGLVEPRPPDGRRRPYALTPAGRDALARSLDNLASVVTEGRRRLGRPAVTGVVPAS